ncbi:unnamed protein product [Linum trigynum]
MTSHGFSLDSAKASSKYLNFQTAEKPDAFDNLLRSHGFSGTQIAKCIKTFPGLLVLDPERILRPKLDFLLSLGITTPELSKVVSSNPYLMVVSLEKCLIPRCNYLKEVLGRDDGVVSVLKRSRRCFVGTIQNNVVRNLALLRNLGVSKNAIAYLVSNFPHVAFKVHSDFAKRVELAKEFGCDPLKWNFVSAIRVFSSVKKSSWEKRLQVYGRWGWSKDLIMLAFKIFPQCMCSSDEKIMQTMDFLVNKLGWESEAAAKFPNIFSLSFEKRVVPRCSVLQLLRLRGLIDDMPCLSTFLCPAEKRFKEKFVVEYPDDIQAELLDLYERRVNVVDFRTMAVEDVKSRS